MSIRLLNPFKLFLLFASYFMLVEADLAAQHQAESVLSADANAQTEEHYIKIITGLGFYGCESYELTLDKDGCALYEGKEFVDKVGLHQKDISEEQVTAIWDLVASLDLKSAANESNPAPRDAQSKKLTVKVGDEEIDIHYKGKSNKTAQQLEKVLRTLKDEPGWVPSE